jgi:hypothetical protein
MGYLWFRRENSISKAFYHFIPSIKREVEKIGYIIAKFP